MLGFLAERCGRLVLTLLLVSVIVFFMLRLMPGDPALLLAGEDATAEIVRDIRVQLGLDQPIVVQYIKFLDHVVSGDLGRSVRSRQPVVEEIAIRLPATLLLAAL